MDNKTINTEHFKLWCESATYQELKDQEQSALFLIKTIGVESPLREQVFKELGIIKKNLRQIE